MTTYHDYTYLDMLDHIMDFGVQSSDRTGTGTKKIWTHTMRFNLQEGFPLLTSKQLHWKSIVYELLWFLRGDTNIKYLNDRGVRIWDEWARSDGELGPVYGAQWRQWKYPVFVEGHAIGSEWVNDHYEIHEIDQLQNSLDMLRNKPNSRQNVVTAWNPGELSKMALPPCHLLFQWQVMEGRLNCALYQRSCDSFLGVPFNIASYSLLTHIMASMAGLQVGEFVWVGGDVHIYNNHFDQVNEQLGRIGKIKRSPTLQLVNTREKFEGWEFDDFQLCGYDPLPSIKAKVAV
jgi:thymidylate synthase